MIVTTRRRVLDLDASTGRTHLSAASGLVAIGAWLYVVADDELALGVFPAGGGPGHLRTLLPGVLPPDHDARKARKPDFEMLLRVPPWDAAPHGALLALGSGSKPRRARGAWFALAADGTLGRDATPFDLSPLYARLRDALPALNLEGAAVTGETLVLLQRASRTDPRSAVVRVPVQALHAALRDGVFDHVEPQIQCFDLGDLDGVPWGCTDAAALDDGRIVFSAVAEDSSDTYLDGACLGTAIGVLSRDRHVTPFERLDTRAKVEGIAVQRDGDMLQLHLVTDADDAAIPAQLLHATLTLRPLG